MYNDAFTPIKTLTVPATDFSNVSPWIYSLRVLDGRREELIEHLRARKIDVGIHFIPVHKHTFYSDARIGDMTVTDRVTEQVVTLPLHSNMKREHVERVIEGVTSAFPI